MNRFVVLLFFLFGCINLYTQNLKSKEIDLYRAYFDAFLSIYRYYNFEVQATDTNNMKMTTLLFDKNSHAYFFFKKRYDKYNFFSKQQTPIDYKTSVQYLDTFNNILFDFVKYEIKDVDDTEMSKYRIARNKIVETVNVINSYNKYLKYYLIGKFLRDTILLCIENEEIDKINWFSDTLAKFMRMYEKQCIYIESVDSRGILSFNIRKGNSFVESSLRFDLPNIVEYLNAKKNYEESKKKYYEKPFYSRKKSDKKLLKDIEISVENKKTVAEKNYNNLKENFQKANQAWDIATKDFFRAYMKIEDIGNGQ